MKNKKGMKVIIGIILILLVIAIGFGIFIFSKNNGLKNDWEEAYFNILYKDSSENIEEYSDSNGNKKEIKIDYYKDANNVKIKFIQLKENETPVMAVSFKQDNKERFCIYYKYDEKVYSVSKNPPIDYETGKIGDNDAKTDYSLQYLYNIDEQEYNWYIKSKHENNTVYFLQLNLGNNEGKSKIYSFNEEEMKTNQVSEDGTPILSKFEETFIEVDNVEDNSVNTDNIHNIDKNELKKSIKTVAKNYKDKNEIITEEIKNKVETKLAEIKQKQEQIKLAEEQKAQKEAEEKAKAEEEARLKAEEEAKKGLKVGSYTLKYGRYSGSDFSEGTDRGPTGTATYTINADGTYTFTTSNGYKKNGTYKVKSLASLGSYYSSMYGLEFSDGGMMGVSANNTLEELAGTGQHYKYVGE